MNDEQIVSILRNWAAGQGAARTGFTATATDVSAYATAQNDRPQAVTLRL
jgi:hypothetical protein